MKKKLSCMFIFLTFCGSIFSKMPDNQKIGDKIWKNECNGRFEGLTSWNVGENFGSFGIGHFIWYPEGKQEGFQESFPDLLVYLQSRGVTLPIWLQKAQGNPWGNRESFYAHFTSHEMAALRQLLFETRDLQAEFIALRLEKALPKLTEKLTENEKQKILKIYGKLVNHPKGLFAMIDYVNFKGEGLSSSEGYMGQGWGLLQVLQKMPSSSRDVIAEFITAAIAVLTLRVENSPPERNESRWLQGWTNRVNSYAENF